MYGGFKTCHGWEALVAQLLYLQQTPRTDWQFWRQEARVQQMANSPVPLGPELGTIFYFSKAACSCFCQLPKAFLVLETSFLGKDGRQEQTKYGKLNLVKNISLSIA